jgi:hypothetical protein
MVKFLTTKKGMVMTEYIYTKKSGRLNPTYKKLILKKETATQIVAIDGKNADGTENIVRFNKETGVERGFSGNMWSYPSRIIDYEVYKKEANAIINNCIKEQKGEIEAIQERINNLEKQLIN